MPEGDDRIHSGRPDGGINPGNEAHHNSKKHSAQTQPPGEIEIIDEGNPLFRQKIIDDPVDEATDHPAQGQSKNSSEESDHAGLEEKNLLDIAITRAEAPRGMNTSLRIGVGLPNPILPVIPTIVNS